MHSKPATIGSDPHSTSQTLNLRRKWMLERDEIYNDRSHTHLALEHLSNLNEHDANTEEDTLSHCEPPSIIQSRNSLNFTPISFFLDLGKGSPDTPIDSEDLSNYYGQAAEETARTQAESLQINLQDSGGFVENPEVIFNDILEDVLEGQSVQRGAAEDSPAGLGKAGESQSHQISPDSSRLSREEKAYNKNLVCYIAKAARRIIFGKCRGSFAKICQRHGVSLDQFTKICDQKKFSGVNALVTFFTGNFEAHESNVRDIFKNLFQKILRRAYLRTAIGEGKMFKLNNYAESKNKYLLYLDNILKE